MRIMQMKVKKFINGIEYEFEIPLNQELGNLMAQSYYGYRIETKTNGYHTELYKINTSAFLPKETKLIGILIYNVGIDQITLYKFVDMTKHKFIKLESFGVNNEIINRLRPKERILISNGECNYIISVRKALTVGKYMQFDKYEKQLFIPIKEFKIKDIKKN